MLKLGISLKRLNEKEAACSSFNELTRRFPDATAILQRAETEKRRAGC
jgi:TolA-binding protein